MAVLCLFSALYVTGLGGNLFDRLNDASISISAVLSGDEFSRDTKDYTRVMLVRSAIDIIQERFWFGTGLGVSNYQKAFDEIVVGYHHHSKAHNFYLSYFAELGFTGFTILIIIFYNFYKLLPPLSSPLRAFRVSFLVIAVMMLMNEYILIPELWFFFGMLIGIYSSSLKKVKLL